MRLDHIAYRVADRAKTAKFFIEVFGYRIQEEFAIDFGEGETAQCIALEPPEKRQFKPTPGEQLPQVPWVYQGVCYHQQQDDRIQEVLQTYHMPPEIFVSDGSAGSVVGEWVARRGSVGGIHHMAYQVDDVEGTMKLWREKGYAEFTSEEPMKCPGLVQCFTKPSELTGVIYELIQRDEFGFCQENVKQLMDSTKGLGGAQTGV